MISLCFRFDDPSPSSDHRLEARVIDVFARHGTSFTIAAIPYDDRSERLQPFTRAQARHLIEGLAAGVVEIAQHGHRHADRHRGSDPGPSEFAGVSEQEQLSLICAGRAVLADLLGNIAGFVPPFNSFDAATGRVLAKLGFDYLSAGWDVPQELNGALAFVPRTVQVGGYESALEEARRFQRHSPIIVVVLHHFDFFESGSSRACIHLDRFDTLVGQARRDPSIAIVSIASVSQRLANGVGLRCVQQRRLRSKHWRLSSVLPGACIVPARLLSVAATGLLAHSRP